MSCDDVEPVFSICYSRLLLWQPAARLCFSEMVVACQVHLNSHTGNQNQGEYFFHLDLDFDNYIQYKNIMDRLQAVTMELKELGTYKKATVYDNQPVG